MFTNSSCPLNAVLEIFSYHLLLHSHLALSFLSFVFFLVFPGLVWWSQTAWFLAEPFPRIPASLDVSRDSLPAATFPEPTSIHNPPFKAQNLVFNSSHYSLGMHTCSIRVSTCSIAEGPEKASKVTLPILLQRCAFQCCKANWWRRSMVQVLVTKFWQISHICDVSRSMRSIF